MFKTFATYFVIASGAMHVFCCGLPLFLSITSLTTIFGISSLSIFEIEWFEAIEDYVLILSGIMLLLVFVVDHFSKKIDCLESGACAHPPCDEKKKSSTTMLHVAAVLYALNLTIVFVNLLTA